MSFEVFDTDLGMWVMNDETEDDQSRLEREYEQEAIRQREELIRAEFNGILDPAACFAIDGEALHGESSLTKIEEAVIDLVAARFSVRRILDVIPQPDADVFAALKSLLDGEIIRPV